MSKLPTIYLDIETLPAPDELKPIVQEQYDRQPGRSASFDEYYRGTSLNANFGQILCIGYAQNDEPAKVLTGSEPEQLRAFWDLATDAELFVGHAILNFDLPFILKRSIIHSILPTKKFTFTTDGCPNVYDTKKAWEFGAGPSISLDLFSKIFGFESSKIGIDGKHVYDFWLAGKLDEIYAYCIRDVELTRKIYLRLASYSEYAVNSNGKSPTKY